MRKLCVLFVAPLLLFFSCSSMIEGSLREGGAADLGLRSSLEPSAAALIRSFNMMGGKAPDALVLDGAAMGRSLASAPGVRSATINNTSTSSLEGTIAISRVGDFLSSPAARGRFITYTEGSAAGSSSIVIVLDKESAPELISRLSPDAGEYLEALLAPAVLGEESTAHTRQEYLDLVGMIYGRPLSVEIAAARIRASIDFPRPVTNVRGGTASGRRVEFDIPLVDLLVLETPLRYEVRW